MTFGSSCKFVNKSSQIGPSWRSCNCWGGCGSRGGSHTPWRSSGSCGKRSGQTESGKEIQHPSLTTSKVTSYIWVLFFIPLVHVLLQHNPYISVVVSNLMFARITCNTPKTLSQHSSRMCIICNKPHVWVLHVTHLKHDCNTPQALVLYVTHLMYGRTATHLHQCKCYTNLMNIPPVWRSL